MNAADAAARRRRWLRGGLAALLMLVFAVAAIVVGTMTAGRIPVLAAARDLPAGTVLAESDVRTVSVAADAQAGLVPASELPRVVGSTTAVPLTAGTLLSTSAMGERWPPAGKAVAAVALEPGRFPPGLSPGARVAVVIAPSPDAARSTSETGAPVEPSHVVGTVLSVSAAGERAGARVVSLLLDESDAATVAAAPAEQVAVVQLGGE